MNNIRPIWSPRDSIDTAHQFHMELHNAERGARYCARCDKSQLVVKVDSDGVCRTCKRRSRIASRLFSRSRFRRARRMDALAVGLLLIVMAAFGCVVVLLSPQAKADAITDGGLTYHQAGQAIAISVMQICPRHTALIKSFAASTAGSHA